MLFVEVAVLSLRLLETTVWLYYEICNRSTRSVLVTKLLKLLESLLPGQIKVVSHRLLRVSKKQMVEAGALFLYN